MMLPSQHLGLIWSFSDLYGLPGQPVRWEVREPESGGRDTAEPQALLAASWALSGACQETSSGDSHTFGFPSSWPPHVVAQLE